MVTICTSLSPEIDRRLNALYPGRLGDKALMGYSMGAFESLFVAATEPTNPPPSHSGDKSVTVD